VNEKKRLGATNGAQELREHVFFSSIDWDKVASLDLKPPFKPKVRSANDVSNVDQAFLEQAPVDSFVHSKISQTETGAYVFKDFEFNRVKAEKNEMSRYEDAMRSLTLNESIASFGLLGVKQGLPSASKARSFKGQRDHLHISIDSPVFSEQTHASTPANTSSIP
jgi:hypothetical protein